MKALAHNIYFNALLVVCKPRMPPGSPKGPASPELAAPSMFQPAGPPSNDEARERLAPCGSQSPWQRNLTRPRSLNRCRFLSHEASSVSSQSPPRSPPDEMRRRRPTTGRRGTGNRAACSGPQSAVQVCSGLPCRTIALYTTLGHPRQHNLHF